MSNQESDYLAWEEAQELKGRNVAREGEIRNLGTGDPCITHNKVNCEDCMQFKKFTPDGVLR